MSRRWAIDGGVRRALAASALLGLLLITVSGRAADVAPDQTLKRLERDLTAGRDRQTKLERQSATFKADLLALRTRLISATDAATRQQGELGDIEATLERSATDEQNQAASLITRRRQIAELLDALYRLSRTPPEALIVRPDAPIDALRSALLLRQAIPALRQRAEALTASLERLQDLRKRLKAQRDEATATRAALTARLTEIAEMVNARETLARETEAERQHNAQRLAALAAQATDLRQLFERLEADRRAEADRRTALERQQAEAGRLRPVTLEPPTSPDSTAIDAPTPPAEPATPVRTVTPPPPPPPAKTDGGGMRLPAGGRIALAYGETDRYGVTSRGLHIAATPGTPVVAPMDGTIKFAGRFRTYGQILIVEHSNGYHSLIAGLGRIDISVGRPVSAGEPLGLVGETPDGVPDLYFELRRNGQPINPRRGIPALNRKGQG